MTNLKADAGQNEQDSCESVAVSAADAADERPSAVFNVRSKKAADVLVNAVSSAWQENTSAKQENAVSSVPQELLAYRQTIDNLDAALVYILAERFRCTKQVGELKARTSLPPADPNREAQQIARLRKLAEQSGLDPVFAEKFLKFIVAEVIRHHEDIAAKVQQNPSCN